MKKRKPLPLPLPRSSASTIPLSAWLRRGGAGLTGAALVFLASLVTLRRMAYFESMYELWPIVNQSGKCFFLNERSHIRLDATLLGVRTSASTRRWNRDRSASEDV